MSRAASIVLLCLGAALLITWVAAPASSEPQAPVPVAAAAARPAPAAVAVTPLRLPERPPASESFEPPTRDPFAYRPRAVTDDTAASAGNTWAAPVAPTVRPPALVAILADSTGGASTAARRAAVRLVTGQVRVVAAGDSVDGVVVVEVGVDAVVFRDSATGTATRVSLRQP